MRARRVQFEEIQSVKFSEILCVDPPGYEVQIGRKKIGGCGIFSMLKVSVKTGGSGGCPPSFFSPAGEIFFLRGIFLIKLYQKSDQPGAILSSPRTPKATHPGIPGPTRAPLELAPLKNKGFSGSEKSEAVIQHKERPRFRRFAAANYKLAQVFGKVVGVGNAATYLY